jgi:deoxyribose-phosphate aldolase
MNQEKKLMIQNIASDLSAKFGVDLQKSTAVTVPPKDQPLARFIDHTLLKPDAMPSDIARLCEEAKKYDFFSVCVNSVYVSLCAEQLQDTDTKVCSVVGFPLGAMLGFAKAFETKQAVLAGAGEIDMVLPVGLLRAGELAAVLEDIKGVVEAADGRWVKVILETSMLNDEQKIQACFLSKLAGAKFVKTSTGFGGGGATVADVELMHQCVGDSMLVKASGGVRTYEDAMKMIAAGASRLGASSSINIVTKGSNDSSGY